MLYGPNDNTILFIYMKSQFNKTSISVFITIYIAYILITQYDKIYTTLVMYTLEASKFNPPWPFSSIVEVNFCLPSAYFVK